MVSLRATTHTTTHTTNKKSKPCKHQIQNGLNIPQELFP